MTDPLIDCTAEVEELRLEVLKIRQRSEDFRSESKAQIKDLDRLYEKYQDVRKRYAALRRDLKVAQNLKRDQTECEILEADNIRIKEQIKDCDQKFRTCQDAAEDLETRFHILQNKLGNEDKSVAQLVAGTVRDLEHRIDLDKVWGQLTEPYSFDDIKSCERKVDELRHMLERIVRAHKDVQTIHNKRLAQGAKLRREYDELVNEYDKLKDIYSAARGKVDPRAFKLSAENDFLRERRDNCFKALENCDRQFITLRAKYAEFQVKWQTLSEARLEERKLRVAELKRLADMMYEDTQTIKMTSKKVTFDPTRDITHLFRNK